MVHKMFSIFDSKAQTFAPPFFFPHVGQALRAWESTVNDPSSIIIKFPNDFALFELGTFDDSTGVVEKLPVPHSHGLAVSMLKQPEAQMPLLSAVKGGA